MLARPSPPLVLVFAAATAAAAAPSLLAYNLSPSPTFLNQALALALWVVFVALTLPRRLDNGPAPVWAALGLLALGVVVSWAFRGLSHGLALSALGMLAVAALLLAGGAAASNSPQREVLFTMFCWAWVAAGLANVLVGCIQVFWPALADGHWIAQSSSPGRATGNLRQPNHMSSLLMWACVAVAGLAQLQRLRFGWAAVLMTSLVGAVVLTASRTGGLSVALLALWGLLDRRLSRRVRVLLCLTPLMYAAAWLGMSWWANQTHAAFFGEQRLAAADISSSRFGLWATVLSMIADQPWVGVGYGNFNFAWTLTPFPGRPVAFFDHTHNLPLQLAVELGLPWAAAVMTLLLWGVVRAARNAWRADSLPGTTPWRSAQSCALMMVVMIGLHSLVEYPLWYAYFLLPACWAFGFATAGWRSAATQTPPTAESAVTWTPRICMSLATVALAGTLYSVLDYRTVARIFFAGPGSSPLYERIAAGQHSTFFSHHADYAAATGNMPATLQLQAFDRASRYLLDTRLMMATARHYAAQGDPDRARYVAARLREFHKPEADAFFAACPQREGAAPAAKPSEEGLDDALACQPPKAALTWRSFNNVGR